MIWIHIKGLWETKLVLEKDKAIVLILFFLNSTCNLSSVHM